MTPADSDEPADHTLRLLREIRDEVAGVRNDIAAVQRRQDAHEATLADVKKAVVGLSYLGAKLAADIADHDKRLAGLETRGAG